VEGIRSIDDLSGVDYRILQVEDDSGQKPDTEIAIYRPSEEPTLWQALVIRTTLQTGVRGMKPSQPEDVGAGSNAQAQPDALGKTQQQDQLNPFAATTASFSPDAAPPGTKPRMALASLVLGITPPCSVFFAYEQGWNGTLPPYIVIFVLCGVLVISISAIVCGVMGIKRVNRASGFISFFFVAAVAGVTMGGIQLAYTMLMFALFGVGVVL